MPNPSSKGSSKWSAYLHELPPELHELRASKKRIADVDRKIMLCSHHHLRYFPHGFAVGSPAKKPDGALRLAVVSESPSFTSASRVRGLVKIRTTLVETAQLQRILKYRNQRYRHRETRLKNGVSSLVIAES